MISDIATVFAGILVLVGAFFALVAVIGLWRLPDIYTRSHAASKTGTLGSGLVLIALAVHAGDVAITSRALAGVVFFLLTAPIAAHLLARAAYAVGYPLSDNSVMDDLAQRQQ